MKLAFILAGIALALALEAAPVDAEGSRCSHTPQCAPHELCLADAPDSTWGRCVRATVSP